MLTNKDLQAIGLIVDERLEKMGARLEQRLEQKLEQRLEKKLAPIISDIRYIKNTLREVIDTHSQNHLDHEHRVTKLEETTFS